VDLPSQFEPGKIKISENTRVVEVTEVLGPSLLLPGVKINTGTVAQRACLGDFVQPGGSPFHLVLPLSMLKRHVDDQAVRVYGNTAAIIHQHRVTPPSGKSEVNADLEREAIMVEVAEDDEDLARLLSGNKHHDADEDDNDDDEYDEALSEDARKAMEQECVDAMKMAEVLGASAQEFNDGCLDYMKCSDLADPPDIVWDRFSSVMGDPFHGMTRP